MSSLLAQPLNILWRSALVKAPRIVPKEVLHITCPHGPHPIVVDLPSPRGNYSIPVFVFVPRSITPSHQERVPVVIDFHGGGFFLGSCLEQAPFCVKLANELDAIVISVDYRMAPVSKFPAAQEDAEDVLNAVLRKDSPGYSVLRNGVREKILKRWKEANKNSSRVSLSKAENNTPPSVDHINLDTSRIAITGFSSGGNLALNLGIGVEESRTQMSWPCPFPEDYPHPFALVLYYPAIDLRLLPSERTKPPKVPTSKGFWAGLNDLLAPTYLSRDRASEYRASPGLAPIDQSLHKNARIQFVLAENDDLTSQNDEWISKASKAGRSGDIVVERYDQTHGWTQMPETWLNEEQRRTRLEAYAKTIAFIDTTWSDRSLDSIRKTSLLSAITVPLDSIHQKGRHSPHLWKKSPRSSARSSPAPSITSSPVSGSARQSLEVPVER